ncbi:MAG: 16S rRNA (adenine(1518)-N(6)/adenine(1519)-N(6))-dimethyltransferase RsmA [bacterium]
MKNLRLNKNIGQHFLKDKHIAEKIVNLIEITDDDLILEIGPGDGRLTQFLVETPARKVTAVEIDNRFAQLLRKKFHQAENLEIINADFLEFADGFFKHHQKRIHIVGNLPYYITSPILFKLLEYRSKIGTSVFTVQKEVADRLTSAPHSKTYGIPSVLFQLYSEVKQVFTISRNSFFPVPEVDSSVIKINFFENPLYPLENEEFFRILLKKLFSQRRKMIRNTLKTVIRDKKLLNELSIDVTKRPENLTIKQFVQLSNELHRLSKGSAHD